MTNDYLANRYGNTKAQARNQRILWTSVGVVLAVAFFIWSITVTFSTPSKITAEIQSFKVVDEIQTALKVSVQNPTKQDGICALQVLSNSYGVVGYKEVAVAGSLGAAPVIDAVLNTTNLGVSATVDRCWFK
jgi:hypothetical protein